MIIEAVAPTRVDLAGGTLDIHPIYLLEEDVWTINAAIEIPVRVRVVQARGNGYTIVSQDLRQRAVADSLDGLPLGGPLDLACRVLRFAAPKTGLSVTLASTAPPGSGLGASSALLVAMLAALDRTLRQKRMRDELVAIAARLEAQSLRTLTGRQDYLSAIHGGVNAIRFGVNGDDVEPLAGRALQQALQERLVLVYTGQPHASGLTNWGVVRAYLDGVPGTVHRLRSIARVARQTREALRARDLDALGSLIAEEWAYRWELASGVSTPVIERALAVARREGALGGKACGAGGGGCVVLFVREGAKRNCEAALRAAGFTVLPMRIAAKGLGIRMTR